MLALKGNQPALFDDVRRFLDDLETMLVSASETDAGHGRIETRTASISGDIAWLQDSHAWPGLEAIGKVTATRQINGKTSTQTRYYLLSQAFDPAYFNVIVLSHWGIENSLHWVLDVIMDEEDAAIEGLRSRELGFVPPPRTQPRQTRTLQRLDAQQTQARRMDTTFLFDFSPNSLVPKCDSPGRLEGISMRKSVVVLIVLIVAAAAASLWFAAEEGTFRGLALWSGR